MSAYCASEELCEFVWVNINIQNQRESAGYLSLHTRLCLKPQIITFEPLKLQFYITVFPVFNLCFYQC